VLDQILGSKALPMLNALDSLVGAIRLEWGPLSKIAGKPGSLDELEKQALRQFYPVDMNDAYHEQKLQPEIELSVLFVPNWVCADLNLEIKTHCHPYKKYHLLTPEHIHRQVDADWARFEPHIRTGDLMCFRTLDESVNEIAKLVHHATQAVSHHTYTHAGIAVVLKHPGGHRQVFMVEALPIEDCTPDFIAQTPIRKGGIFCWDMLTRLHQAYAVVSWCPLKYDLDKEREMLIERFLARQWVRDPTFDEAGMVEAGFLQATQLAKLMSPINDWKHFFCSELVGAALRIANLPELSAPEVATSLLAPGQIADVGCFLPPICLKIIGDEKIFGQHAKEVLNARQFKKVERSQKLELIRMPRALFEPPPSPAARKDEAAADG